MELHLEAAPQTEARLGKSRKRLWQGARVENGTGGPSWENSMSHRTQPV